MESHRQAMRRLAQLDLVIPFLPVSLGYEYDYLQGTLFASNDKFFFRKSKFILFACGQKLLFER